MNTVFEGEFRKQCGNDRRQICTEKHTIKETRNSDHKEYWINGTQMAVAWLDDLLSFF